MGARLAPRWYEISDEWGLPGGRQVVGVIRYSGAPAVWRDLVGDFLKCYEIDMDYLMVEEPEVRWYRFNPDWTREFSWLLTPVEGPGRGNWQGARIIVGPRRGDG